MQKDSLGRGSLREAIDRPLSTLTRVGLIIPAITCTLLVSVYYHELGFFTAHAIPATFIQVELLGSVSYFALFLSAIFATTLGFLMTPLFFVVATTASRPKTSKTIIWALTLLVAFGIFIAIITGNTPRPINMMLLIFMFSLVLAGAIYMPIPGYKPGKLAPEPSENSPFYRKLSFLDLVLPSIGIFLAVFSLTVIVAFFVGTKEKINLTYIQSRTKMVPLRKYSSYWILAKIDSNLSVKSDTFVIQYSPSSIDTFVRDKH